MPFTLPLVRFNENQIVKQLFSIKLYPFGEWAEFIAKAADGKNKFNLLGGSSNGNVQTQDF